MLISTRFCRLRAAWFFLLLLLPGLRPDRAQAQTLPAGQGLVADTTELRALRALYAATGGPQWTRHTHWPATPAAWAAATLDSAATWQGVYIWGGDVCQLSLSGNHLVGQLPASFSRLTQLSTLFLGSNQLGGELPASLAELVWMNQCFLDYNQFTGSLTGLFDRWTDLQSLGLSHNQFTGPVPGALGALPRLYSFDATHNALTGALPAALGRSRTLWGLFLADNHLQGSIPGAWAGLMSLGQLMLDHNELSGVLPDSLCRLVGLGVLDAQHNRFTGSIPASWKGMHSFYRLDLSDNQLTGPVPDSLKATFLLLQNNHLSGELPASYGTTHNWQVLLDGNNITRIPRFPQILGYPYLQLGLTNNYLQFDSYEPNQVVPGQYQHWDYGQRTPPGDTLVVVAGRPAGLNGTIGGAHNHYQWQRLVGGVWADLPGDTLATRNWAAVTPADAGAYHTRVSNRWVPAITLASPTRVLDVVPYPALARNRPDDANTGPALLTPPAAPDASAPNPGDLNFVRTWVPRVAVRDSVRVPRAPVDSVATSTTFLDGLGRPVQTVQRQASPGRRDVVQPLAYDALGREPRQYLPYVDTTNVTGQGYHFRPRSEQQDFYFRTGPRGGGIGPLAPKDFTRNVARTGVAYSETLFEPSPLNRVAAQGAPGEAGMLTGGHATTHGERPNVAADSVPRFVPGYDPARFDPDYQGYYAAGELWGNERTDEHGRISLDWTDKEGHVVLKQVEAAAQQAQAQAAGTAGRPAPTLPPNRRWLRTAYAYDDFGRLQYVLPPEATRRVLALGNAPAALPTAAVPYLFRYRFDGRGRPVAKQVPGTDGETLVVFDQLDRPVLSQDASQRLRKQWSVTKYDALGRVVITGLLGRNDTAGQATIQALADANVTPETQYEVRTAAAAYADHYTYDRSFPRIGQNGFVTGQLLSVSYYDDYNFDNDAAGTADVSYDTSTDSQFPAGAAPVADVLRATGMATRTKTRVLDKPDTDTESADWLVTTTFYDERARPVQVQTTNARKGLDLLTTRLDFTGKVVQSVVVHAGPNHAPLAVAEFFRYDHAGRLLTTHQQLPGEARPVRIDSVAYNELGQARQKTMGTGRLAQQVDYAYNIRGWLTSLNDPYHPVAGNLFNLSLHYEAGFSKGYEQYNGNLTGQTWRSSRDGVQRAYGYVYDPLNRLLQGDFVARNASAAATPSTLGAWRAEEDNYRFSFASYDDNGNLLSLRRRGLLANATHATAKRYGAVDNLTYAYAGNRLQAVDDAVSGNQLPRPLGYEGAPTSLAGDFQEGGTHLGQEYLYDANGNLTQDRNKGISGIGYNHLNLPRQIHFGIGADSVVFRYTAAGQKVAKLVYQAGKPVLRTDYLGPYQYEQDSLRFFPHAEGRVLRVVNATSGAVRYEREFSFKDHLGNLRLAYRLGHHSTFAAGLEPADASRESQQFDSLSVSAPVAQPVGSLARTGSYVAKLNAGGAAPQPLGALTQLAVQKGDTVTVTAPGHYPLATSSNSFVFSLASFVAGLLQPQPNTSRLDGRRGGLPLLSLGVSAGLPSLVQSSGGVPKGYVRLLVFDADSNLVTSQTRQLSAAAHTGYEALTVQVIAPGDGYVTAYVGNESAADVYFDDVTVSLGQNVQVQETQYDPVGLELAGLGTSTPGLKPLNQYKFNGKEFQTDLGLNWNHQDWRFFDTQLGRWHVVDPLVEKEQESWTPYQFGYDNAVRYSDPSGLQGVIPSQYVETDPMKYLGTVGLGVFQGPAILIDKLYAFTSNTISQILVETPPVTVAGVGVRASTTIEAKAETKYQPTLMSFLTPNNTNKPNGTLYTATTSTKVTSVQKADVSVRARGANVRVSASQKTNVGKGTRSNMVEASVGVGTNNNSASAAASLETDSKGKSDARATLKIESQPTPKTRSSFSLGLGINF